jgi:hypothetical protein
VAPLGLQRFDFVFNEPKNEQLPIFSFFCFKKLNLATDWLDFLNKRVILLTIPDFINVIQFFIAEYRLIMSTGDRRHWAHLANATIGGLQQAKLRPSYMLQFSPVTTVNHASIDASNPRLGALVKCLAGCYHSQRSVGAAITAITW